MSIAYQYDASGYYAGAMEDHGLLPNNATPIMPQENTGYIPHWNGSAWDQVENHKGEEGYRDGTPFTINEYGPYPHGWSTNAPELTLEEKSAELRAKRDSLLAATDYLLLPDTPANGAEKEAIIAYRKALRDLPGQTGFPGSIVWPEAPRV